MIKYELRCGTAEFKKESDCVEGCTLERDQSPEIIKAFNSKEEALEELKNYNSKKVYMKGNVYNYYIYTEYYIEQNEYDDENEWISGGDVWEYSQLLTN